MYVATYKHSDENRVYIRGNQYKKIVPILAVPEPNSPDGVIPEYPSRGDFLAGSNL